jgi:hypothetical protein
MSDGIVPVSRFAFTCLENVVKREKKAFEENDVDTHKFSSDFGHAPISSGIVLVSWLPLTLLQSGKQNIHHEKRLQTTKT